MQQAGRSITQVYRRKGKEETEGIGGGGSGPDERVKEKKRTEWEITGMTAGNM